MAHTSSPSQKAPPTSLGGFIVNTGLLFLLWLLLTGTLDTAEIAVGLLISALVAWLSQAQLALLGDFKLTPWLPWYLLVYLLRFFYALLLSNFDVARRVLSPDLPINPAIVEVRTQLQSRLGKLALANSITLTPGTLTVDVLDDRLQVHWIDSTPGADLEHATQTIAAGFEQSLREFLK